ncbi:TPA: SDR family NAD(P)-dependent oxidoreductase [Pseudomonas aeruginosa]
MADGLGAHALAHHQQTRLMQARAQVLHRRGLGDRLMAMTPLRGILNITSMGGYITMPGIAYYCGSKFALEGVSDALGKEVASLDIAVTAVAPGSLRTDWAGRSMVRSPRTIADYDALFDPLRQARQEKSGKQPGDPRKAARAMLQAIDAENPPAHLLLGSAALGLVRQKLKALEEEIAAWEELTRSTDG